MKNLNKNIVLTASVLGALTVIIGAFGAHGLKQSIEATSLKVFETGVLYQMFHTLAILALGFAKDLPKKWLTYAFVCFSVGIVLFSGSLYVLSTSSLHTVNVSFLGPVTPLGGLFFILGWIAVGIGTYKTKT